jgi:hypothetical protein
MKKICEDKLINHEIIKGFSQLSRCWDADELLEQRYEESNDNIMDVVTFGLYDVEGSSIGDVSIEWIKRGEGCITKLSVLGCDISVLSKVYDVVNLMSSYDCDKLTPEEFCELLLENGFIDMTQVSED